MAIGSSRSWTVGSRRIRKRSVLVQSVRNLLLLLTFSIVARGTCAIAAWTPERIILGADSRETILNPDLGPTSFEACKIRQIGVFYVIISGITEHRRSGFNVWEIIARSVRATNSVPEAAEAAAAEIARRYADVLKSAGETSARGYVSGLESNAPAFAIAGFSHGGPYLAHYEYNRVRGRWTWRKDLFGRSKADTMGFAYLCDPRGIARYKRSHPGWRRDDPVKTVSGMIAATAAVDSSEVGGETSLLVVDRSGSRWVNPGRCR